MNGSKYTEKEREGGILDIVRRALFIDFIKGLAVTLRYNLSKSVTMRYPDEEKWVPHPRYRGVHTLNRDEKGRELCVACELCARACPTNCITVVPMEDDTGRGIADRVAKVWKVDLVRCLFCGYCEDACPTYALRLGKDYERACTDLSSAVVSREELLMPQEVPWGFAGGVVVGARLQRTKAGIKVVADLSDRKASWFEKE